MSSTSTPPASTFASFGMKSLASCFAASGATCTSGLEQRRHSVMKHAHANGAATVTLASMPCDHKHPLRNSPGK